MYRIVRLIDARNARLEEERIAHVWKWTFLILSSTMTLSWVVLYLIQLCFSSVESLVAGLVLGWVAHYHVSNPTALPSMAQAFATSAYLRTYKWKLMIHDYFSGKLEENVRAANQPNRKLAPLFCDSDESDSENSTENATENPTIKVPTTGVEITQDTTTQEKLQNPNVIITDESGVVVSDENGIVEEDDDVVVCD